MSIEFVFEDNSLQFHCPGCNWPHKIPISESETKKDGVWKFDGDLIEPTISPSVRHTQPPTDYCCHYFIKEGKVEFLNDCTHALAGQTK